MLDNVQVQSAVISYLKSQSTVTSLLGSSKEIRESQWQGVDFSFPAIRAYVDLFPSINGCGPDRADVYIETFSEQKSSLEANTISGVMAKLLHKHPFTVQIGPDKIRFSTVVVKEVVKAERSIYGWLSKINMTTQVNAL